MVFIDRRFSRHLPIQSNYVGQKVDTITSEKVIVEWEEINGNDQVILLNPEK
jgi:pyrimidine operon attenuation protein/uracil phosphoribosyltransferase